MKRKNRTIVLFAIIYASIFGIIFFINSRDNGLNQEVVSIGVISPSDELASKYEYLTGLAQEKINSYCNQSGINMRFVFNNSNAESDSQKAYEIVKKYNTEKINLIVGLGWNSQLNTSYEYLIENDMVIISPSSTSPAFSINDSCFRLLPDDKREAIALADAITNYGIDTVIILQRNCNWGNNFSEAFYWEYKIKGGEIMDRISYASDNSHDINSAIERANSLAQNAIEYKGADKVGVLLIALEEASDILLSAENSSLMNITWFCTETNTLDKEIQENAGQIASKVGLIGPFNTHIYNEDFREINRLFFEEFGEPLDFCLANVYDGCWLLALSVIETESTDPLDVSHAFGAVAYNHYGITGPLDVNSQGDRSWIRYYFYGYYEIDENVIFLRAGGYTRLEKNEKTGSSISHSPDDVLYDNFPYYIWEKQYESK